MALLEIKDLEVFYGKARALSGISLTVEKGQSVGIIGPNGAGKSTLLDSIIGLTDWQGEITFDGIDLSKLPPSKIISSLKIGYAPERGNLFRYMNVKENLLVGAYCSRDNMDDNPRSETTCGRRLCDCE